MAESVLFGVASELLSTISTEAFKGAVGSVRSIWHARDELATLKTSIETIRTVLVDAEKRQDGFDAIKNWTKKVKDVLYDADDLFDEVTTDDMLTQEIEDTVKVSCCKFHFVSRNYLIAKKVKAIRKRLDQIARDMAPFEFVPLVIEDVIPGGSKGGRDPGSFVDAKGVIGRDEDKKVILEMLFNESNHAQTDVPLVIAIVGIGGMGKTTLAQLIYNDIEVQKKFEECWFACISNTSDDKEVLSKICQAICRENCYSFTVSELQSKIREKIKEKKFLLVLDDVWDTNRSRWQARLSLLGGGAKESKVIVTTRLSSVAMVFKDVSKTHNLGGLSDDDSWDLFKRVAFAIGNENEPRRIAIGKKIVKKCRNVPLAIKSLGSLLFDKNNISEWESILNENLPKLGENPDDGIFPVLKLSYDHLSSKLKKCFSYCSLFPEDYEIVKDEVVCLWIAQGYITSNKIEEGNSVFMDLFMRGFFQEGRKDDFGEIERCQMHDLIRDLALHVAGEESVLLTTSTDVVNCTRHVSVGVSDTDSWGIPATLLKANRLRSFVLMDYYGSISTPVLGELFRNFKLLRTLGLNRSELNEIPSCIGELKHLRYLDLSENEFESVPDSLTNLVNLLALNLESCEQLKALPDNFRKLINLRYLNISFTGLMYMPFGIEELTCLEYLSNFFIGKANEDVQWSGIDALSRMQQLRGKLNIYNDSEIEDWDGCDSWELPVFVNQLSIWQYPGIRIPQWSKNDPSNRKFGLNLASLQLEDCYYVKYLPSLRFLPCLRFLTLLNLNALEYVEEEEGSSDASTSTSTLTFFPCLEKLQLFNLPNLKGWRREAATEAEEHPQEQYFLPLYVNISRCKKLTSLPLWLSSRIQKLKVKLMPGEMLQHILSTFPSLPLLEKMLIVECNCLRSVHVEALPSLRFLQVSFCHRLKNLQIVLPNSIEELEITDCEQLELWEQDEYKEWRKKLWIQSRKDLGLSEQDEDDDEVSLFNWDSLPKLRRLQSEYIPPPEKLPERLQRLHAEDKLKIIDMAGRSDGIYPRQ